MWKASIIFDSVCFSGKPFNLCAKKEPYSAGMWKVKYIISPIAVKAGFKLFIPYYSYKLSKSYVKKSRLRRHIHFIKSWTDSYNTVISVLQKKYFWEDKDFRKSGFPLFFPLFPFLFPLFSAILLFFWSNFPLFWPDEVATLVWMLMEVPDCEWKTLTFPLFCAFNRVFS